MLTKKWARAEAIVRFLNLNAEEGSGSDWQGVWKVLLYDDYCHNVLAPLLKVGELRKQGITLHMYASPLRCGLASPLPEGSLHLTRESWVVCGAGH